MRCNSIVKIIAGCVAFFFLPVAGIGQEVLLKGKVIDANGAPLYGASVVDAKSNSSVSTNSDGAFELMVQAGEHTLVCSLVGYVKKESKAKIKSSGAQEITFVLEPDPALVLQDVVIIAKSNIRLVEESGFNVVALDATPFHNSSVDLAQVLDKASGVKIQQDGGLGSETKVTINGLSGRHVRFFVDGMPMDAMSSAFQLNNLPINLADRIEIYKGVVPVNFGSDALGGAVNIVTKKTPGKYVDASYSYGSFNTHQTFINTGLTTQNGFTVQLSAYQNYSDNNYIVDVSIKDFETNILSKNKKQVRRFHDVYHNETAILKLGMVQKRFADQLLFGLTLGQEYDEIQHPAYLNLAFGDKFQTSTLVLPSFLYKKKNLFTNQLDFSLAANYNFGGGHNVDTSSREYNWLGQWKTSNSKGEIQYSDYVYKNHNGTVQSTLNYAFAEGNRITVNNVTTFFKRKGDEKVETEDAINLGPRINNRNILGASLNSDWSKRFSTSLFGKMYSYFASAYLDTSNSDGIDNYQTITRSDSKLGYGCTATYFLSDELQLKGNYERTCRLPENAELFGEVFGFYLANFELEPEISHNFNVGGNYNAIVHTHHGLSADINLFYRRTSDFIRRNINYSQGEGSFENIEMVTTAGVDAELRYSFKDRLTCGGSVSYLRPKNMTKGSTYYDAIVPNQPNFFGNADISGFFKNIGLKGSRLSVTYHLQFIHEFLYDWSTYKASNRLSVPSQWNHSFSVVYSWKQGRYNTSLDCKNLLDDKLYDNYSLQKPGRSLAIKFRYYFRKV